MTSKATREDIDHVFEEMDKAIDILDKLEFTEQVSRVMNFVQEGKIHSIVLDLLDLKRELCKEHKDLGVWF